jgi:hypothetical protein
MGERIGRIGRIDTDFFWMRVLCHSVGNQRFLRNDKKIRVNPPDPPNPFSHRITILHLKYNRFAQSRYRHICKTIRL